MIILTTSSNAQTLKVIPRDYLSTFVMSIKDDSTNIAKHYEITGATTSGNYLSFTNIFNTKLIENHFYDITLGIANSFWNTNIKFWQDDQTLWNVDDTSDGVIYKDKIFCTAQSTDQTNNESYSVNKDEYKSKSGNNDFIIL